METKVWIGIIISSVLLLFLGGLLVLRPSPTFDRSSLLPAHAVTRGPKDAPVYLVEFSDFQCPACKTFAPIVEQILKKHEGKILFAYRHFPLPQHTQAQYAALAFEAANEQHKAWEMYAYLFTNQKDLSESVIQKGAKEIGLDIGQFENTMKSNTYEKNIQQDLQDAKALGVNSTPTFFLNGKKLNLFTPEDLSKAVDEAILNTK
jgi:protein-disulfide isomerase